MIENIRVIQVKLDKETKDFINQVDVTSIYCAREVTERDIEAELNVNLTRLNQRL